MAVETSTDQWRVDGRNIMDLATSIEPLRGRDVLAPRRYRGVEVAYRHGEIENWDRYFGPKRLTLDLWVAPWDADGAVTHTNGAEGHIRDNLDSLWAIFGKKGSAITLQRDVPVYPGAGELTLEADAQVVRGVVAAGKFRRGGLTRRLIVDLLLPYPFWRETPVNTSLGFTTGNIVTGGNAPIANMVITFKATASTPRLTHDDTGDYIEITGTIPTGDVEVDVGARTVTKLSDGSAYDANLVVNRAWWMEWPAADAALGLTLSSGTADLSWYDQWH